MSVAFKKIGLFAKYNDTSILETFQLLIDFLEDLGVKVTVETQSAQVLKNASINVIPKEKLGKLNDLVIVLGGDGSLLNAARAIAQYNTPILGINRGRLGFLADIHPNEFQAKLYEILQGTYSIENRALLNTTVTRDKKDIATTVALNDSVLYTSDVARMLDFEVWINKQFVLKQRADGLIVATPTGSTAYALSAGGPILYPTITAFSITPMLPHTLSSRPIVVDSSSKIELVIANNLDALPKISCDGQVHLDLLKNDRILIQKYSHELQLIHPVTHNYFEVLRKKLGWSTRLADARYSSNHG